MLLKIFRVMLFLGMVVSAHPAQALYFDGGSGDGFASSSLGYSRSWGFYGGSGRGEALTLTASQTLMSFFSAATQTFSVGDGSTTASTMTIRQDTAVGTGITSGSSIYVNIPAVVPMIWNTAIMTATVTGKVSSTVSYLNGGKTLVLTANADFSDGDTVTVADLAFKDFTLAGYGNLLLDITAGTGAQDLDLLDKLIQIAERSNGFIGGSGRGETMLDIYQHPGLTIDFGTLF